MERLFDLAAWADKYEGAVHQPPMHGVTLVLHEPVGNIAFIASDDAPLLGLMR